MKPRRACVVAAENAIVCGDRAAFERAFAECPHEIQSLVYFTICKDKPDGVRWLAAHADYFEDKPDSATKVSPSPLHIACTRGSKRCALALLQRRAVVDALDDRGRTPLELACRFGHRTCAKLLLDRGASLALVTDAPTWARDFLAARERCRTAAVLLLGMCRFRRAPLLSSNSARDVVRLIAERVWLARMHKAWGCVPFK